MRRTTSLVSFFIVAWMLAFTTNSVYADSFVTLYDFMFDDSTNDSFTYRSEYSLGDTFTKELVVTNMAHVDSENPTTNYANTQVSYVYELHTAFADDYKYAYAELPSITETYIQMGYARKIRVWANNYGSVDLCETPAIDENSLTWNSRPGCIKALLNGIGVQVSDWVNFPVADSVRYVQFSCTSGACNLGFYSDDYSYPPSRPHVQYTYAKYGNIDGRAVVQTGEEVEAFSLTRLLNVTIPVTVNNGSRITVTFETNSSHAVGLKLGISNLEFVPEGNGNLINETKVLYLSRRESITQVQVVGALGNEEYLKIDRIQIENCSTCLYNPSVEGIGALPVYIVVATVIAAAGAVVSYFVYRYIKRVREEDIRFELRKACEGAGDLASEPCRTYTERYKEDVTFKKRV